MKVKEAIQILRDAIGDKANDKRTKEYKALQRIEKELHIVMTPIEERIKEIFEDVGLK